MSVYIDDPQWERWHGRSGHMVADTIDELTRFAEGLGLDHRYAFLRAVVPHYQLPESRRQCAIQAGAIALDRAAFMRRAVACGTHPQPSRPHPPSSTPRQGVLQFTGPEG